MCKEQTLGSVPLLSSLEVKSLWGLLRSSRLYDILQGVEIMFYNLLLLPLKYRSLSQSFNTIFHFPTDPGTVWDPYCK